MNLSSVDLNLLVVLDALLVERSVTRAGRRVGLSQPAMSHALARLRALLGDPLFVREGRLMVPTPRAEALAEPLAAALASLGALVEAPEAFDPLRASRSLRISSTDYAQVMVLPALCAKLQVEAPGIDLLVHPTTDDVLRMLARGELDLALGPVRLSEAPSATRHETLFDERFVCLVRKGHPLTHGKVTPERFAAARHAFIAPRGRPGGAVDEALAQLGLGRRVAFQSAQFLVAPYVVAQSDLVITIPARVARMFASKLGLATFAPPVSLPGFSVSLIWHERSEQDPALAFVREAVRELFRARRRGGPRPPGQPRPARLA